MGKSLPLSMSKVTISGATTGPAMTITKDNTLTIDSGATIQMGSIKLTEGKLAKMDDMLEFVERFVQEDERAKAIWVAIKAKKRILG
jgi:hypothetical protein